MMPTETEECGQGSYRSAQYKRSHIPASDTSSQRSADATRSSSMSRAKSSVPTIGQLLDNFKVPDGPRVFKSEPIDDKSWQAIQAEQQARSSSRRRKELKSTEKQDKSSNVQAQGADCESSTELANQAPKPKTASQSPHRIFVDLTEDTQDPEQLPRQPARPLETASAQSSCQPKHLAAAQLQALDQARIPSVVLEQARQIYGRENIILPVNVTKWSHLKAFAAQNPASSITPQLCEYAQANSYHPSTMFTPQQNGDRNDGAVRLDARQANLGISIDQNLSRNTNQHPVTYSVVEPCCIKVEKQDTLPNEGQQHSKPKEVHVSAHSGASSEPAIHSQLNNKSQVIRHTPATSLYPRSSIPNNFTSPSYLNREQIHNLTKPSNLMLDLLPPDAPEDHPKLVEIWGQSLLELPLGQHEHLNLQNTVVSLLARYDFRSKSAIQAFLDIAGTNHFFFLFQAKESTLHSWSIEREEDIITIGIERSHRPPHDTESSRPSSGQYDVTIQYRIVQDGARQHVTSTCEVQPDQTSNGTGNPTQARARFPGRWVLHGTTILPSSPDLSTFLHKTPPTRGADEHVLITHPLHSHLLDSPTYSQSLSILARYMQHTALTSGLMDAEIQCVWGRKVRYDAILGRVRCLWNSALKSAKTMRAKRERGEYNRPKSSSAAAERSRDNAPGTGQSRDHLAGLGNKSNVPQGEAMQANLHSMKAATGRDLQGESLFQDRGEGKLMDNEDEERRVSKKIKTELQQWNDDRDSGSEYRGESE